MSALTISNMTLGYGGTPAVVDASVTFPEGSMTAIVGPNGAGKSTLLKGALGIVKPLAGNAAFFGQSFAKARTMVAYVPQRASVDWDFPARVIDVVMMGLYARKTWFSLFNRNDQELARAALARVGMQGFAERQIGDLSGGQQQRVFLARALAEDADLFILDEPFAGVDVATEAAIVGVLKALRAEGRTVVAVHHDLSTVAEYFDRVVLINRRVLAEGSVADVFTEARIAETYGARVSATSQRTAALA